MKNEIKLMRTYDFDSSVKGQRVLVDKLWPRGIKKEKLEPMVWEKEIAPSSDLRKWFHHEPERFEEFEEKYLKELEENKKATEFSEKINEALKNQDVILLYSAKDEEHNNAVVLKKWLEKQIN